MCCPPIAKSGSRPARRAVDAFQGAAIPLIWLDEDIDAAVLKEIFIRIGPGFKRRILWTLTAVNGLDVLVSDVLAALAECGRVARTIRTSSVR